MAWVSSQNTLCPQAEWGRTQGPLPVGLLKEKKAFREHPPPRQGCENCPSGSAGGRQGAKAQLVRGGTGAACKLRAVLPPGQALRVAHNMDLLGQLLALPLRRCRCQAELSGPSWCPPGGCTPRGSGDTLLDAACAARSLAVET